MSLSLKERYTKASPDKKREFISTLTDEEADALVNSWDWEARPEQLPPDDYRTWMILSGRGFGKTRAAAEAVVAEAKRNSQSRIAVVARSAAEARDICVEGPSGLLAVSRMRGIKATYEASKRRVTWENGAIATMFTSEEPDQLRGFESSFAWCDELASWKKADETLANLRMGLRFGDNPRLIITTTPRPTRTIIDLRKDPNVVVTTGSTFDNVSNLPPTFLDEVKRRYEGTRLGRQELFGEVLEDVEGALWTLALIEDARVEETPPLKRIVIAVDPATTTGDKSDFTGITVAGVGFDDEFYVLYSQQMKATPNEWANRVLDLYDEYDADRIIAERNNGGLMVESTLRTVRRNAPITTIHASKGKKTRAEPVAALYEQGKVHHTDMFADLEDQMIVFPVAAEHDDMVDSLVYALTELAGLTKNQVGQLITYNKGRGRRR